MIWRVSGAVKGGTCLGEFEADTAEQAIEKAKDAIGDITLCNQCEGLIEYAAVDEDTLTAERAG